MKAHTLRYKGVIERLENQLQSGVKREKINGKTTDVLIPLTVKDVDRINKEISTIESYLAGNYTKASKQKRKQVTANEVVEEENTRYKDWIIEIYSVKFGFEKKADRKNSKGSKGSRRKMKKKKTLNFIRSVAMRKGLMRKFRDGLMGISPKNHVFKLKNTKLNLI